MATWILDPAHSEIDFRVRHMMITNVKGEFQEFTATIDGEDFETGKIRVEIATNSVNTRQKDRDAHLRSADFFDSEQYPNMVFESEKMVKKSDDEYVLEGNLTIKDVTKPVSLDVEFGGINKDPWGNDKAGFSLKGKINRKEWGLDYNAVLETGGVLLSEEIRLAAEVQFQKQA